MSSLSSNVVPALPLAAMEDGGTFKDLPQTTLTSNINPVYTDQNQQMMWYLMQQQQQPQNFVPAASMPLGMMPLNPFNAQQQGNTFLNSQQFTPNLAGSQQHFQMPFMMLPQQPISDQRQLGEAPKRASLDIPPPVHFRGNDTQKERQSVSSDSRLKDPTEVTDKARRKPIRKSTGGPRRKTITAYSIFGQSLRSQVESSHPEYHLNDVNRELGRRWKELPKSERMTWEIRAKEALEAVQSGESTTNGVVGLGLAAVPDQVVPVPVRARPPVPVITRRRVISSHMESFGYIAHHALKGGRGVNHNASRVNWPCLPQGHGHHVDIFQARIGLKLAHSRQHGLTEHHPSMPRFCEGGGSDGTRPCGATRPTQWFLSPQDKWLCDRCYDLMFEANNASFPQAMRSNVVFMHTLTPTSNMAVDQEDSSDQATATEEGEQEGQPTAENTDAFDEGTDHTPGAKDAEEPDQTDQFDTDDEDDNDDNDDDETHDEQEDA